MSKNNFFKTSSYVQFCYNASASNLWLTRDRQNNHAAYDQSSAIAVRAYVY